MLCEGKTPVKLTLLLFRESCGMDILIWLTSARSLLHNMLMRGQEEGKVLSLPVMC